MGSRSLERGAAGLKSITDANPEVASSIEVVQIDVTDDASVSAAFEAVKSKGTGLYALVNNAGVGLNAGGKVLPTNFYGPKRVSEAFLPLVTDRIVNVSSGAASMWLRNQDDATKKLFTSPDTTWDELDAAVKKFFPSASMGGYGLSKAGLTAYTILQAKAYPNLLCTSLSPGFIQTKMTAGYGARLTPDQGTVSLKRCLARSQVVSTTDPMDFVRPNRTRDPGTPEYGERIQTRVSIISKVVSRQSKMFSRQSAKNISQNIKNL